MRFLFAFLLVLRLPAAPIPDLSVGSPFPNFSLANVSGGQIKPVRSYLKKKTVLHIFASW